MKAYKLKGVSQSYSCMQDSLSWNHKVHPALNNLKISNPVSSISISGISGLLKSSCNFMNALIKLSWCCLWNPIFLLTSATYFCPECEQKANLVKTNHYFSTSDLAHYTARQGWAAKKKEYFGLLLSAVVMTLMTCVICLSKFSDSYSSLWTDAELERFIRDLAASSLLQWRNSELKCSSMSLSDINWFHVRCFTIFVCYSKRTYSFKLDANVRFQTSGIKPVYFCSILKKRAVIVLNKNVNYYFSTTFS